MRGLDPLESRLHWAGDPVAVSVADVSLREPAGVGRAYFAVVLSRPAETVTRVGYATADGSAVAGVDYVAAGGTLTFAVGQKQLRVAVAVTGDPLSGPDRTFDLVLTPVDAVALSRGRAKATVVDAQPPPVVSVMPAVVKEGNSGMTALTFTARLSRASRFAISVAAVVEPGTATAGDDYVLDPPTGTLRFAPGALTASVTVAVVGDTTPEPDETVRIRLFGPEHATLDAKRSTATGTIANDDGPVLLPPATLAGRTLAGVVKSGRGDLAGKGGFALTTAGDAYTLLGSGDVADSNGRLAYSRLTAKTARLLLTDANLAGVVWTTLLTFTSAGAGSYRMTSSDGGMQDGRFTLAA